MEKDSEKDGKQIYDMEIEFPGKEDQYDDKTSTDIYELKVEFEKSGFQLGTLSEPRGKLKQYRTFRRPIRLPIFRYIDVCW